MPTTTTPQHTPPPLPQILRFVMLLLRQYYHNHFVSKTSVVIPSQHLPTQPPPHGEIKTKMVQQLCTRGMQPPYHGVTTSTTIYSLNSSRHFANKSWFYYLHHGPIGVIITRDNTRLLTLCRNSDINSAINTTTNNNINTRNNNKNRIIIIKIIITIVILLLLITIIMIIIKSQSSIAPHQFLACKPRACGRKKKIIIIIIIIIKLIIITVMQSLPCFIRKQLY